MGCRNPFRFSIDSETNYLYWGDIGPDARDDVEGRGPRGHDEVNQAKAPGFFGWPYFVGNNKAYNDFDFATNVSGDPFDPANPVNNSPNNTGATNLPPAQPAMVYYPYAKSEEFPLMGTGGRNAMAGPVYHYDKYKSNNKFPAYYDDKLFMYDWMRGQIYSVTFDDKGDYESMEYFLPNTKWNNLMDVVMGPEGDFYTIEYGTGWFTANQNAILSHLKYIPGNRVPKASFKVDETAGGVPFVVSFDASESHDSDGDELKYDWDFGDGNKDSGKKVSHSYTIVGNYNPQLTITDKDGETSTHQLKILAGNTPPNIDIQVNGNQDFYFPEKGLDYSITAKDVEDGNVENDDIAVTLDYLEMGHDMTSIAQGHMALSEMKASHPGIEAISKTDCVSCHKVDGASIGPSYTSISEKYRDQRRNRLRKYLVEKIKNGGSGVWGETAMAAHPDLEDRDAASIADYIIGLARKKVEIVMPSSGVEKLEIPKGKAPGGKFVVMASYTDKGADGVEPLRSFKNLILRSPIMSATEYETIENGRKFKVTPQMAPGIEEEFEIVMIEDGAIIEYENLDLTDIGALTVVGSAPAMFAAGGTMSVYIDDDSGDPLFSSELKPSMAIGDFTPMTSPLPPVQGRHKVIIKCKSAKEGAPMGLLTQLVFTPST